MDSAGHPAYVVEGYAIFTRAQDGVQVRVNFTDTIRMRDGLVSDMRLYRDYSQLFA